MTTLGPVMVKKLPISAERVDSFLNPSPAGIVYADDRAPGFYGLAYQLGDFLSVNLAQASSLNGEVLGVDCDFPAVNLAKSSDYAVIRNLLVRHAECRALVAGIGIYLVETVLVAEGGDALYGVKLALSVLFFKIVRVVSHIKIVTAIALQVNDKIVRFVK